MYSKEMPKFGDVFPVKEFIEDCESGMFIDYDGYGHPVKDNLMDESIIIKPSQVILIPSDADSIIWFNR